MSCLGWFVFSGSSPPSVGTQTLLKESVEEMVVLESDRMDVEEVEHGGSGMELEVDPVVDLRRWRLEYEATVVPEVVQGDSEESREIIRPDEDGFIPDESALESGGDDDIDMLWYDFMKLRGQLGRERKERRLAKGKGRK